MVTNMYVCFCKYVAPFYSANFLKIAKMSLLFFPYFEKIKHQIKIECKKGPNNVLVE